MNHKETETQSPAAQPQQVTGFAQRFKDAVFVGSVVASTALIPTASNAGELGTLLTGASEDLGDAKTAIIAVVTAAVTIIGIIIGWRYFKKGAN